MAPTQVNGSSVSQNTDSGSFGTLQLENLLVRDADAFQTTLSSEDYLESLAPIITDALRANALADFITKLNNIVKGKDEELSEKSLSSANDINTCINSIDQVSNQSSELKGNLKRVNDFLNKSVFELISKKKALIKTSETSNKINETIVVLNTCIQVLEITNKIHDWIKQHKYFSALKLIEELTSIHLPKVKDFSFSVKIYDSIPHLTSMIKEESFDAACKWLSTQIERKIEPISEAVFANLEELNQTWETVRADRNSVALFPHRLNSAVELSMRDAALNISLFEVPELTINLGPIYDCVLVYQSLGELQSLCAAYHKEWMKKYQRIIYPITLSLNAKEKLAFYQEAAVTFNSTGALEAYLHRIAAFFTVDKQLNTRTKFELRSNDTANDLWDSFATKLKPVLLQHLEKTTWGLEDLNDLADYKDVLGSFLQVMENSQYRTVELHEILMIVFKQYFGPILIQHFRIEFNESMQSDHFMPLVVTEKDDYDNVMKICWYKNDASFAPRNFHAVPISLPFSEDYVHYCLGMRTLLQDVLDFTVKYYSTDFSELNQIIVNDIFERVLGDEQGVGICNDIKEFIERNQNNKEIVAQTYTNLEYYLFSLYEIGKVIDRRLRVHNGIGIINIDTNSTFKLKAIELFAKVRKFSENAIFKMVDQKVTELLDMVEYDDWFPAEDNRDPNFFILDFSLFLENLFNSIFSNLPISFRTLGLFRSYDFISEYFLNLLNDAELYNRTAIFNFDLDVKHLETSMAKLVRSQAAVEEEGGSVALQSTFAELRQTIDLLLLDDHEEFIKNASFRMRRFDRLKYELAVKLIQKLKSDEVPEDNDVIYSPPDARGGLTREASILSGAKFSNWGKFRKGES